MSSLMGTREDLLGNLRREWDRIVTPPGLQNSFSRLTDEWRAVEWQSGGRTLLTALGLQYQEVPLCRGLAWLLDPAGGHRMGAHLVEALIEDLKLSPAGDVPVRIRVEEWRGDTRADVVLRAGPHTVVIEAKVYAGEQTDQADRLWSHFADENPTLVFLTRTGYLPYTAKVSGGRWVARTWRDVAQLAQRVSDKYGLSPSAGARDFIETIGAL